MAERGVACSYFAGEINGDGGERDKEVNAQLRKLRCDRVEKDLAAIRVKYQKDPGVLAVLEEASQ